jgi:hypothetical protein
MTKINFQVLLKSFVWVTFVVILFVSGCAKKDSDSTNQEVRFNANYKPTKSDADRFACSYLRCSQDKRLYLQNYVRNGNNDPHEKYRPAGTFALDKGVGAFSLDELDKYGGGGASFTTDQTFGFDPCPYCNNMSIGQCSCGKLLCVPASNTANCPWCGRQCHFVPGNIGVGGGGG